MKVMKHIALIFPLLLLITGCNQQAPKQETKETTSEAPAIKIPVFNEDSAFDFVKKQLDFGPRVNNTPAHEKAGQFLEKKLREYTGDVFVQKGQVEAWDGTKLNFKNFIGSFNKSNPTRIILCSHWDSRPYADHDPDKANWNKPIDGANDGASGVGILLEVARQLSKDLPDIGVDILLLDAEDYGPPQSKDAPPGDWWGLGSQYWSKNPHVANYKARYGILLDMVGATGATFLMETISMNYASDVVQKVWSIGNKMGYGSYFLFEKGIPVTDDHLFMNQYLKIPTIDIIHQDLSSATGFYPYWHTVGDNLSTIDRGTLKAVGQTLMGVIYTER